MKKLIELNAALDALREVTVPAKDIGFGDESTDGYNDGVDMAITVVSGLPTVDAVPVRHGHWIYHPDWQTDGECGYECSECGMGSDVDYQFCMRCGADMRKDGEHHETD